jgi:hypothetical protein
MWLYPVPIGIGTELSGGDCYRELPRIPILRRWVNKGKKRKGGGLASPTISAQALSGSVSDSLGRHLQFKSRRHTLGGLGQDER